MANLFSWRGTAIATMGLRSDGSDRGNPEGLIVIWTSRGMEDNPGGGQCIGIVSKEF